MLFLYASDRVAPLAQRLAEVFSVPPVDPMTPEWLAVPSAGMQRWILLELARHLGTGGSGSIDGVAANIELGFPGSLRERVFEAARPPATPDPWQVDRLTWTVLEVADRHRAEGLPRALVDPPPETSRFGAARKIADHFDRYHVHRHEMIRSWAEGRAVDGLGRPLPRQLIWQQRLWSLCRDYIGEESPPERLPGLLDQVRSGRVVLSLPERVVLFGLTLLPGGPAFLELAEAVAAQREVHVFLLEPSTSVRRLVSTLPGSSGTVGRQRSEDDSAGLIAHPLLRSWGRLHRETAVLLADASGRGLPPIVEVGPASSGIPASEGSPMSARPSLLSVLQAGLRSGTELGGSFVPDPGDRSIQLHACYGPARQVEVLRDVILHLLADRQLDLCEDEIVVLCPAVDELAPIIEGVLGPSADLDPVHTDPSRVPRPAATPLLRYRLADRSIGTTNPVFKAVGDLTALVVSRFDAASVLDFVTSAPVRQRFGFTDEDIARLAQWVESTNIRWGLDADHRVELQVPAEVASNTWQAGCDRVLLGTAVRPDGASMAVGDVVPFDTEPGDAGLAGRFAQLLDVLGGLQRDSGAVRPIGAWIAWLQAGIADLLAVPTSMAWQSEALHRVLRAVLDSATVDGVSSATEVTFGDLRRILDVELKSAPGRPSYFRGGVTFTSMAPLRGIPFRVVCLLGLDQAAFPAGGADCDDLTAWSPQLGDGDLRGDARQALLEAVLAAGDRLVILRSGHDVQTNQEIPAPVVVAELVDTLAAMVDPAHRDAFVSGLEVAHPRQAFDVSCFEFEPLTGGPWSFDSEAYAGALARRERSAVESKVFLPAPLSRPEAGEIALGDLHRFFRHPVRTFLSDRLGARIPEVEHGPEPVVPLELARRARSQAGERLLRALQDGRSVDEWAKVEARLGTVPPGVLGPVALDGVATTAVELYQLARALGLRTDPGRAIPVDLTLVDGTRITGTVIARLGSGAEGPCEVRFARGKPLHKVGAWLDLMSLVASRPDQDWRAVAVGRGERDSDPPAVFDLVPVGLPGDPIRIASTQSALEVAVDLYRRGLAEPIPLFAEFSHAVAAGEGSRDRWQNYRGFRDGDDEVNSLVFGGYDYDELMAIESTPEDPDGPGGRVECFARCLWDAVERSVVVRDGAGTAAETSR